ncbi:Fic family protein [Streptococcus cuniculi]|uniref:protein adenylyltransferase n=1 Tax=Streptococcus cuniculi TaxID=1432788 RepID=A0A4Y9J946_9STRE|nr:Fic family protein [Streptococcus cuniculi]MBF0778817.1 Fic family protein [Streptococcus cuniculi]TFU97317.1 cell filamentation protein Fic [Streptococcus cuniculi]
MKQEYSYEIDNPILSSQTKQDLWETGFGLQKVDGLKPSLYMVELAKEQIVGKLSYEQVYQQITKYHEEIDDSTKEADIVSLRIVELLSRSGFKFAPVTLKAIHKDLFLGLLPQGVPLGEYRPYNLRKDEPILGGDSVIYDDYRTIAASLAYDFEQESQFNYQGKTLEEMVEHLQRFISGIWQIHPFGEGNTRTVTVFMIKYLRVLGFEIDNSPFKEKARYFRDALVLDNATVAKKNSIYLTRFFETILLDKHHLLSSRQMFEEVLGIEK